MEQILNFRALRGYPMLQMQERLSEGIRFYVVHSEPINTGDKICTLNSLLGYGEPNAEVVKIEKVEDVKFPQHHTVPVKHYTLIAKLT